MNPDFETRYPRRIIVDDKDLRVIYSDTNTWNLDISSFNDYGTLGEPYNRTMTGTASEKASFTFTFEGNFFQVRGAKDNRKILALSNTRDPMDDLSLFPNYTCKIDNEPIPPIKYESPRVFVTNLVLCEGELSSAEHTLTMDITLNNPEDQIFWVDSIEYSPLETANMTKQVLKVDSSDSRSCFYSNSSKEWYIEMGDFDSVSWTVTPNASMSFKFNGTSVSMYGINARLDGTTALNSSAGSYSIDGNPPIPFVIPGTKAAPQDAGSRDAWANQLMFENTSLSSENEHEMAIYYNGTGTNTSQMLVIDYFYVANDGAVVNGNPPGPVEPERKAVPTGGIVGGVLGGVFGLIAIGGLLWFTRRRRRHWGGPRELPREDWDVEPYNIMSEAWTGEPLRDSRSSALTGTAQSTTEEPSTVNFASMKHAQREVVNGQTRQEQDSGFRYTRLHSADIPPGTATIPPAYTPE
ncbi:hypothetical protein PQX77_009406 [Marasmius sp. AFHP31]|nr:hypothetical protein PQX77_009406 [Marasmius sp. AFHP31]